MKKNREMKGSEGPRKRFNEAGDMIPSDPVSRDETPSLSQLLARELDKLRDQGRISPIIYTIARDQAYAQSKVLKIITPEKNILKILKQRFRMQSVILKNL